MKQENKNEKFQRIAEARTNKIVHMIRLLGNCANKNTYTYTKDEVEKIFTAIEDELRRTKVKFGDAMKPKRTFSLK